MTTSQGEYSVCQFFADGTSEYVARFVSGQEAVRVFRDYTRSVGAHVGFTKRVIITDGGDSINFEWEHGKGITFPPDYSSVTEKA